MPLKSQVSFRPETPGIFNILSRSFIGAGAFILCMSDSHYAPGLATQLNSNEGTTNHEVTAGTINAALNTVATIDATSATLTGNWLAISGIFVDTITAGSAVINWTTDVPANSQVNYGATTA